MTTSRFLVINADDYGYSPERDAGILDCYHDNSISSVSLMVNGCHAKEAVEKAKIGGLPMGMNHLKGLGCKYQILNCSTCLL